MSKNKKELGVPPLLIQGGIFIGLFSLVIVFLLTILFISVNDQLQTGVVAHAHQASLAEQQDPGAPTYPYRAIQLAHFAYQGQTPKKLDIVQNIYQLYGQSANPNTAGNRSGSTETGRKKWSRNSFSVKHRNGVAALDHYSSVDTSLRLYTLSNGLLKYRPSPGTAQEKRLDLRPYLNNLSAPEVRLSANGKNLQLLSSSPRAPSYWINGKVYTNPWVTVYRPNPQQEIQAAPSDSLANYLGYYNFFSGKFVDPSGKSYARGEVSAYFADLLVLSATGFELWIDNDPELRVQVDSLFDIKLIDKDNKTLDLEALGRLKSKSWWPAVHQPEISELLGNSSSSDAELIALSTTAYQTLLLWDLKRLQDPPKRIDLTGVAPSYLTALTDSTLLSVDPDGEIVIWDTNASPLQILKNRGAAIFEFLVSPNHQHIVARTALDSVIVWDLWGNRLHAHHQENINQFVFSNNGLRLMSVSPEKVGVWSAQNRELRIYSKPSTAPPISFARFQDDGQHIIVGLVSPSENTEAEQKESFLKRIPYFGRQQNISKNNRIIYWNPAGQTKVFSKLPSGPILDATVHETGDYAVVLQTGIATIIPGSNTSDLKKAFKTDLPKITAEEQGGKFSTLSLSPAGNYIIRQSPDQRSIELFDRRGNLFNAFDFPSGFRAGFQGKLFTPDDYFMIANRPEELWFWHPESFRSGALLQWADQFALDLLGKQQYELDTIADYIPGTTLGAKNWAVPLMLVAFLFMLLYFSDFIIEFIQGGKYLEFLLYLGGFFLLITSLVVLWRFSIREPELNSLTFYATIWIALAQVSIWVFRDYRHHRNASFYTACTVGLFLIIGSVLFSLKEREHQQMLFEEELIRWEAILQKDYQQRKSYYNTLLGDSGTKATADPAMEAENATLSSMQLLELISEHESKLPLPYPSPTGVWLKIFLGLLVLLAFIGLIDQPVYRAVTAFRRGDTALFYRWLLLPVFGLSAAFWSISKWLIRNLPDLDMAYLLYSASGILMLFLAVQQSSYQIKKRRYLTLFVYAVPTIISTLLLFKDQMLFPLAMAGSLFLGLQYQRDAWHPYSFGYYSGCIFLGIGIITQSVLPFTPLFLGSSLLSAFLFALLLLGLKKQLANLSQQQNGLLPWLMIAGIWLFSYVLTIYFPLIIPVEKPQTRDLIQAKINIENDENTRINPPSTAFVPDTTAIISEMGNSLKTVDSLSTPVAPLPPPVDSLPPAVGRTSLPLIAADSIKETPNKPKPDPVHSPENISITFTQEDTDSNSSNGQPPVPVLAAQIERRMLIEQLFHQREAMRQEALMKLAQSHKESLALVDELIQATYRQKWKSYGIESVLTLMEMLSEEQLRGKSYLLRAFFRDVYNAKNSKRIDRLRARISS